MGHGVMGWAHFNSGDIESAIKSFQKAVEVSADPFYSISWRTTLAVAHTVTGDFRTAGDTVLGLAEKCEELGFDFCLKGAQLVFGIVSIATGQMSTGMTILRNLRQWAIDREALVMHILCESCLGGVFLKIVQGEGDLTLRAIVRNLGFLIKNVPFAAKKAEDHFNKAIEVAQKIGGKGLLAQAHFNLYMLHKAKKRKDNARECITKSIEYFELCEAETFLKHARQELASLE